MANIDEMQFTYVPEKAQQMLSLCFVLVDLEKAFDCVPRSVLWWAFQGMSSHARMRVNSQYSEQFNVGVGVNWGSVLNL